LLTLPSPSASPLSVRAKALLFEDPLSLRLLHEVERLARSDAT
jgi:sigma-54 dependent transcriptional regulator